MERHSSLSLTPIRNRRRRSEGVYWDPVKKSWFVREDAWSFSNRSYSGLMSCRRSRQRSHTPRSKRRHAIVRRRLPTSATTMTTRESPSVHEAPPPAYSAAARPRHHHAPYSTRASSKRLVLLTRQMISKIVYDRCLRSVIHTAFTEEEYCVNVDLTRDSKEKIVD